MLDNGGNPVQKDKSGYKRWIQIRRCKNRIKEIGCRHWIWKENVNIRSRKANIDAGSRKLDIYISSREKM